MKTASDKWDEFINDPELNDASKHPVLPNGEYLFRKISHDTLECLNAILGYLNISAIENIQIKTEDKLSKHIVAWLTRKKPQIESWVSEITLLTLNKEQTDWKNLITKIGLIISGVDKLQIEYKDLLVSSTSSIQPIEKTIARIISRLRLLLEDIEEQNYKRLWVITKYSELVDNLDNTL